MKNKIYHIHLRKTGGTTVNYTFMALSGADPGLVYSTCAKAPDHVLEFNGLAFASELTDLSQPFFYAHGHRTVLELQNIGPDVFLFTVLRDPVRRFVSYWQMLSAYKQLDHSWDAGMKEQLEAFDDDILAFAERIDRRHMMPQLFTYSADAFDPAVGLACLKQLDMILSTEHLAAGLSALASKLRLPLKLTESKKVNPSPYSPTESEVRALEQLLAPEIEMVQAAHDREWVANGPADGKPQ